MFYVHASSIAALSTFKQSFVGYPRHNDRPYRSVLAPIIFSPFTAGADQQVFKRREISKRVHRRLSIISTKRLNRARASHSTRNVVDISEHVNVHVPVSWCALPSSRNPIDTAGKKAGFYSDVIAASRNNWDYQTYTSRASLKWAREISRDYDVTYTIARRRTHRRPSSPPHARQ